MQAHQAVTIISKDDSQICKATEMLCGAPLLASKQSAIPIRPWNDWLGIVPCIWNESTLSRIGNGPEIAGSNPPNPNNKRNGSVGHRLVLQRDSS